MIRIRHDLKHVESDYAILTYKHYVETYYAMLTNDDERLLISLQITLGRTGMINLTHLWT